MMIQRRLIFGALMLSFSMATVAFSEAPPTNLLKNPSFTSNIAEWKKGSTPITMVFNSKQGSTLPGGSGPGCLELQQNNHTGTIGLTFQSIAVVGGRQYEFAVSTFLPNANNAASEVSGFIYFYNAAGTTLSTPPYIVPVPPLPFAGWTRFAGAVVAPQTAVTASVGLGVKIPKSDTDTRTGVVYFDDAYFAELSGPENEVKEYFLPVASSKSGQGNTFWITDMWMTNLSSTKTKVSAAFLQPGQDNSAAVAHPQQLVELNYAGGFYSKSDIASYLGAHEVTGALYLRAESPAISTSRDLLQITSRNSTPNPLGSGRYGQGVIGVGPGTKTKVAATGILVGTNYRTNIGVLNTSGETINVLIEIRDKANVTVSSTTWTLKPYEPKMMGANNMGVTQLDGGTVYFELASATGSFRSFISVADNGSADSIYVPAS